MRRRAVMGPLVVLAVVGGLSALAWHGESRSNTPEALERAAGDACVALLHDDRDAMRYSEGRLDEATDPDVVAIHEYLAHDKQASAAIGQTGDIEAAPDPAIGHGLLVRAAEACTDLGHPELKRHLYDETGNEDYAPR